MKKLKFVSTLASIALCIAVMVFGVVAANQVTFSVSSTISYTVEDVFVEIETRVYSSSKLFDDEQALSGAASSIKSGLVGNDFNSLDTYKIDNTYALTPIDLMQDGAEDPYSHKFRSQSPNDTPSDLGLSLEYSAANGGVYSYFIVIKVTNISSIPLYSFVRTSELYPADENVYTPPTINNLSYKQAGYITLSGKDDFNYIVFAIGLEDVKENVPETTFKFPIEVTKDDSKLSTATATLNFAGDISNYSTPVNLSTQETVVIANAELLEGTPCALLNFTYDGTEDVVLQLSSSQATFSVAMGAKNNYYTVNDAVIAIMGNSSLRFSPTVNNETVTIPSNDKFCILLELLNITDETIQTTMKINVSVLTQAQGLKYLGVESAIIEHSLQEGISGGTSITAEKAGTLSGYAGGITALLKNIDTSHKYVKITSDILNSSMYGQAIMQGQAGFGLITDALLEKEYGENKNTAGAYYLMSMAAQLADGSVLNAEDNSEYISGGYFDDNGCFSWIIPCSYIKNGTFDFALGLSLPGALKISFKLSFNYVDQLEINKFVLCGDNESNRHYSWGGFIWAGFAMEYETFTIPSSYNGLAVTSLETHSIRGNFNNLIIPATIETIADDAFYCAYIDTLTVECSSSYLTIETIKDDFADKTINKLVLKNYAGELPLDFIFKWSGDAGSMSLYIKEIYVPDIGTNVSDAQNAYNTRRDGNSSYLEANVYGILV